MKKLFTLVALLACFLGVNAKTVVDVNMDFSTYTDISEVKWGNWGWSESAQARLSIKDGCLHFESTEATDPTWDCQFFPVSNFEAEAGVVYTLHFKVKGDHQENISMLGLGQTPYGQFPITTEWVEGTVDYECTNAQNGWMQIQCGGYIGTWDIAYLKVTHEEEEQEKPVEWENIVTNGDASTAWANPDMAGTDEAFGTVVAWSKEWGYLMNSVNADAGDVAIPVVHPALMEDGAFVCHAKAVNPIMYYIADGTTSWGSEWHAGDQMPDNTWQNQFWIAFPRAMKDGEQVKISFKFKASKAVKVSTQDHKNPGSYLGGGKIGDINFGTDWDTFEKTFSAAAGVQSIAFNVTGDGENWKEDIDFYFDDITVSLMKLEEGFFVASQNKANGVAFNFSNAIEFEDQEGVLVAVVGEAGNKESYVNELMISTVRGENKSFKAATLKVDDRGNGIESGDENWYDYSAAANAVITLPVAGVWQIMIDPDGLQMNFVMIEGDEATGISNVENKVNTGSAVIYNLAGQRVSKDYKGIVVKNGKKVVVK